jgi:SAM-dependent methyltransferase
MRKMSFYTEPRAVGGIDDCFFYHTMEVPGVGLILGDWDLRANIDDYLGRVSFAGTRVLEIGPASGFLTFTMEQRGANVVSLEVADDPGWDFVPYPRSVLDPILAPRRESMWKLKNSYWFAHAANRSSALLYQGDAYNLPAAIGDFDTALMANVLLHCRAPLQIVEQCARRAKTLIITEILHPEIEGSPVCRLVPTAENQQWDTWWQFSTDFFRQYLRVLGFSKLETVMSTHTRRHTPSVVPSDFDEADYFAANPDVAAAFSAGQIPSGAAHYEACGHREGRKLAPGEGNRVVENIDTLAARSETSQDSKSLVDQLNRTLRGWANYFKVTKAAPVPSAGSNTTLSVPGSDGVVEIPYQMFTIVASREAA